MTALVVLLVVAFAVWTAIGRMLGHVAAELAAIEGEFTRLARALGVPSSEPDR